MRPLRPSRRLLHVMLFLAGALFAGATVLYAQSSSLAGWAGDIDELLAAMDSIHPAPYRAHGRAEWEAAAAELKRRLPSLRYHEAVAEIGRLVALAEDGHTRLGQVSLAGHQRVSLEPGEGFAMEYPIVFEAFSDGLYAVRAAGEGSSVHALMPARAQTLSVSQALMEFDRWFRGPDQGVSVTEP